MYHLPPVSILRQEGENFKKGMMNTNELIPINYDSDRPTVSAQGLYKFLEAETQFSHWFERMTAYGFTEHVDYEVLAKNGYNPAGGRPATDYQLTVDMAKEICMIQRTERGKEARRYFLQIEKDWNTPEKVMARALEIAHRKIHNLEEKAEQDAPKVLFADAVATAKSSILIGELAKLIRQNGYPIGQKRLFQWLRCNGYLNTKGEEYNNPSQYSMERGLMEIKVRTVNNPDGTILTTQTTKITGKGQQYFINKFLNEKEDKKD